MEITSLLHNKKIALSGCIALLRIIKYDYTYHFFNHNQAMGYEVGLTAV